MTTTAVGLVLYAALLGWFGPALLTRLTRRGINPKLGVTAWLTAVLGVIGAWLAAVVVLVLDVLDSVLSKTVWTMCLEVLGYSGHIDMARPLAATTAAALIVAAVSLTALVARRIVTTSRALHSASRQHAAAARVVGVPTRWRDVFVVQAERPAAYCVSGRPRAIVVTSAAVARLQDDQLVAVLAHEQAHLSGRHHHVLLLLRAVAAGLPRVPIAAIAPGAVLRLLEMCADDIAARRHGSYPLLCGLITLVAGPAPTAAAMGAASIAVLDRASRLASPVPHGARWRDRVRLCTAISLTTAVPLLAGVLCHH